MDVTSGQLSRIGSSTTKSAAAMTCCACLRHSHLQPRVGPLKGRNTRSRNAHAQAKFLSPKFDGGSTCHPEGRVLPSTDNVVNSVSFMAGDGARG